MNDVTVNDNNENVYDMKNIAGWRKPENWHTG